MTTINDPSDSSSDDINVSDLTQDQLLVLRKAYLDGKFSSKQLCFDGADMLIEKINSMETTSPIQQCIIDKKNKLNVSRLASHEFHLTFYSQYKELP